MSYHTDTEPFEQDRLMYLYALRDERISQRRYKDARAVTADIDDELLRLRKGVLVGETRRQDNERRLLEGAKRRAVAEGREVKNRLLDAAGRLWEDKICALEVKHDQQAVWEKTELAHKMGKSSVVLSGQVRDLKNAEKKLRSHLDFVESEMCRKKVNVLEKRELEKLHNTRATQLEKSNKRVDQKHDLELSFVKAQMRRNIAMLARASDNTINQISQRYTNYSRDMSTTHTTELSSLSKTPHFIQCKTKPRHPYSTRGTQLTLLQQGSKRDQMPSLVAAYGHTLDCYAPLSLDDSKYNYRRSKG